MSTPTIDRIGAVFALAQNLKLRPVTPCRRCGARVHWWGYTERFSAVFTIGYVANLLGEDENWIFDLSIDMFPEDGCLWVHGAGEDGVPAFTRDGIENLRQSIADERAASCRPPAKPAT